MSHYTLAELSKLSGAFGWVMDCKEASDFAKSRLGVHGFNSIDSGTLHRIATAVEDCAREMAMLRKDMKEMVKFFKKANKIRR